MSNSAESFPYWLEIVSKCAGITGVIVAIVGGYIALQSHRANVRNASNALIHGLFKDYLMLRWKWETEITATGPDRINDNEEGPLEQIASIKLYVLEEMFAWIRREEKSIERIRFFLSKKEKRIRHSSLAAWEATIKSHLRQHRAAVRESIFDFPCCYGIEFLRFISQDWNEPGLSKLVHDHYLAVISNEPRPPGRKEANQVA